MNRNERDIAHSMKIRFYAFPVFLFLIAVATASAQSLSGIGQATSSAATANGCTAEMQSSGLCGGTTTERLPAYGSETQTPSGYINPMANPYGQQLTVNAQEQYEQGGANPSNATPYGSRSSYLLNNIKLPPEPLTGFQKFVASTSQQVLPIYGASLFTYVPSTFSPLNEGPVPADYVLGPGDQVHVNLWGQVNFATTVRIDRNGNIYLPQVGEVHLSGVPASLLQSVLKQDVARVFRNFQVSASLGQIRSIQVYVVGNARRPGVYTISSLSTLVDALFASGGPSPQGTMRNIEVRRNGRIIAHLDLYSLLLHGDRTHDVPLLSGDVIFIPSVGPQAAVLGSVNTPAIYELLPGETLGQLIQDAGGASAIAAKTTISIERIEDHEDRMAMNVAFNASGLTTPVEDGDLVRILPIVPLYQNTITLRGNTANPGRFAWHPGMRLSDLIPDRESLITRNYWWRRAQLGLPAPEFEPLQIYPALMQPNRPFDLRAREERLRAEGINPDSPEGAALLSEEQPNAQSANGQQPSYRGMSSSSVNGSYQQTQAYLQAMNQQQEQEKNTSSSLASQAEVRTENTMGASAPIKVALPAPDIDWSYAVIERLNPQTLKTSLIPFDLGELVIDHDPSQNLLLEPGDVVTIFSQADIHVPQAQQTKFVRLEGEFVHAGIYSVKPGETLRELVEQAGGLTPSAYLYGSAFTRVSTRVLQQQRINQYVQQLSIEMQRGTLATASLAMGNGGAAGVAAEAQQNEQGLLAQLKEIKASGRIVLNMKPGSEGVDAVPNLPLEDGDSFVVPTTPSTVNVVGAVYDQNSFLYKEGLRAGDYLRMAGGENRDADRKHAFIIRADGSVVSRQMTSTLFGNDFMAQQISPGDTIVIPEKVYRPSKLQSFLPYTQLFSSLTLSAAALNAIN